MLDAAYHLAERGIRIFPCHTPIINPLPVRCSCSNRSCRSIGKHPRENGWRQNATNDLHQIQEWWHRWPSANIGMLTGEPNGFDVLDIDPKNGGDASLDELEEEHGPLPATIRVRTGSGGYHILFKHTPNIKNNNTGKIKPGIDLKTTGGFVIAPPSIHMSGNCYEWLSFDYEIVDPPDWLSTILQTEFKINTLKAAKHTVEHWDSYATGVDKDHRHNAILEVAGLLWAGKPIRSKYLATALVHGFNAVCCNPPKSTDEVNKIINWVAKEFDGDE